MVDSADSSQQYNLLTMLKLLIVCVTALVVVQAQCFCKILSTSVINRYIKACWCVYASKNYAIISPSIGFPYVQRQIRVLTSFWVLSIRDMLSWNIFKIPTFKTNIWKSCSQNVDHFVAWHYAATCLGWWNNWPKLWKWKNETNVINSRFNDVLNIENIFMITFTAN